MNTYLQYIWEYIINFAEAGLFYYYIRTILTPKKIPHQTILHALMIILRVLMVSICNTLELAAINGIVIVLFHNLAFSCLLFKGKKIVCFFWSGIHCILCLLAEFLAMILLQLSSNILPSDILWGESYRFPVTTLYIIILTALSFFVPIFSTQKTHFKNAQKLFVTFFIILGIIISYCFMNIIFSLESTHPELVDVIILTNLIFLCIFFALYVFIYQLAITQQEKEELQEKARLLELEEVQYRNLLSTTETLRSIKHDIHHHLATIESLIQQNETERLTSYLKEYQTHFNLDYTSVSSGNIVIDSILSTKQYFAKQQHIELSYAILLPDKMPFTDVALSALLGNLFDNAMEACRHITESDRFIHFQMKTHENMLLIHIENSFDGIINEPTKHVLLSRKREVDHGIGLKRVKTLVEEVNGFTDIRYEKNTFIVHIIAPLETTHEH